MRGGVAAHSAGRVRCRYKEGGPAAEARFEAGVAGFEARAYRGCGVFTSEPFEVSDDADSMQMLTRNSQVGEFYIMQPPQVDPTTDVPPGGGANAAKAAKARHTCDMMIFDEEKDRHMRVTWNEALKQSLLGANDADLQAHNVAGKGGATMRLDEWKFQATKWAIFNGDANDAQKNYAADIAAGAKADELVAADANLVDLATIDAAADVATTAAKVQTEAAKDAARNPTYADLDQDIRIVVARPFIEHLMHSVVLAVAGRETGATLFGPADMQLSANTQVKTIEGTRAPFKLGLCPCARVLSCFTRVRRPLHWTFQSKPPTLTLILTLPLPLPLPLTLTRP